MNKLVDVYQIGSRAHYVAPLAMHNIGALNLLITDFYLPLNSCQRKLLNRISSIKPVRRALFNVADLPDEMVRSTQLIGYLTRFLMPLSSRFRWLTVLTDMMFGWAASRISMQESGIVWGFTHGSLEVFKKAKQQGCICVLEQFDPAMTEIQIVQAEEEKWPGFNKSKPHIPSAYRRLRNEWELADHIVVNSEWSRNALIQQGVAKEKLEVIPLAYELKVIPQIKETDSSRTLKLLWVGTCCVRKGIHILLEASRVLAQENVEFHIAGPIDVPDETRIKYASKKIIWYGQVPKAETHALFECCDVFVIPTLSDGFAITQLEAMSHAMPVIATQNCGRVVDDGLNGKLVDAGNVDSLVAGIRYYIDHPDFLRTSSAASLETMEKFGIDAYEQNLRNFLSRISG